MNLLDMGGNAIGIGMCGGPLPIAERDHMSLESLATHSATRHRKVTANQAIRSHSAVSSSSRSSSMPLKSPRDTMPTIVFPFTTGK